MRPRRPSQRIPTSLVAVDCGGTWLKAASVDAKGTLRRPGRRPTEASRGIAAVVENMAALAREVAGGRTVEAAGVAMPGSVDAGRGVVHQSPNFPDCREFALAPRLAYALGGATVAIENDANAYAVGEMWRGAARKFRSFLCLTLGTGVGGAVILDGRLWRGAHGMAGELGHTPLVADGPPCTCGSRGCLEVYASTRGLQRAFEAARADGKPTSMAGEATPEALARAARGGDPAAREAWETMGRRLGAGIAGMLNAFDVEAVVVGGGLSAEWDLFGESVRQQVGARAFRLVAERAAIVPAGLGDDAGVLGMARLARARLEGKPF